jgi:AraC-like DNA-binding protein
VGALYQNPESAPPTRTPGRPCVAVDQTLFASPLARVGKFRCPVNDRQFRDLDRADEYLFVFPRTAVWIAHEGDSPFVADPNVVPLYNAGQHFHRRPISAAGDRTDWFAVSPAVLRDTLKSADPGVVDRESLFRRAAVPSSPQTFLFQRRVVNYLCATESPDSLLVEEAVIRLLAQVLQTSARDSPRTGPLAARDLVEETAAQLNGSFLLGGSLGALAASVHTSVFHLCRVFKNTTGQTIHGYRTQLRLRRSLELLKSGDGDILATALAVGFSSHSHFTRVFHRALGITPSDYKLEFPRAAARRRRECVSGELS